nr:hypothetical protein [Tanacetum cinerariifolium]
MNYVPVVDADTNSTNFLGTKVDARKDVKKDVSSLRYIVLPNWVYEEHLESISSQPQEPCNTDALESSGNSNPTTTSTNPLGYRVETLTVESPIPTFSLPVPTVCFTDSREPSSETRLISKRVTNQAETPSLDNILTLTNQNLFPPLDNPELTIQKIYRSDPTLLNNSEMAAEGNGDLPVPDLRTMEELCQPSLNGRGGPIAPISIQETNFRLKNDMIQQVQNSCQFHGLPFDDANKHLNKFLHVTQSIKVNEVTDDALRLYLFPHSLTHHPTAWFDHLPRNSINTFEQMAKMFLEKYFSPSMVTKLINEITNFRQRHNESLFEAWERYKLSIDRCPNHNVLLVTQIDTFYSGLTLRHRDTINAAAGGTFMKSSFTSFSDTEIAALKAEMTEINKNLMRVLQVNQQVKEVASNYETCGGPHSFNDCPATVGNTQNVYAAGPYQGNTITNPKEDLKGITTRSGTAYQGPTIPTTTSSSSVVERETEATKDMVHPTNNESTKYVQPSVVLTESLIFNSKPVTSLIIEPVASPDLNFNISFVDALILMPKFGPSIKSLLTNKDKLYPSKFLILCDFPRMAECLALVDLGAGINQMPLYVWNKLTLPDLSPTCMTLELANCLISHSVGIAKDVFIKVGTFHFPADFIVVDFDADPRVPLILRRYFLKTERALIDVFEGELTLRVGKEAITFNLDQTSRYLANYNDMTANRIDIIDMDCKEYSQEVLSFSDVIASGNPIPYYDPIVSTTSLMLTPFGNSDFLLEEVDAFLAPEDDPTLSEVDQSYVDTEGDILLSEAFLHDDPSLPPPNQGNYLPEVRKELKICEAKYDKSSIDEPLEVALKDLPPHLEYAFLEGDDKFPIIIALSVEEKTTLITVLKSYKRAIAWRLFDIKENEENETILTRLVTGWRLCIDCRKLNEATCKDHFPLPFMDQILERLTRNQYYYFLNGFSGYFQIPIDLKDQEKTTFTYPYGMFAYRCMPFRLCNAPGTFQSFLGHASFYQRFIKDFSKIARPMTRLLENDTPFLFSKEFVEFFQTLKRKLTKAPILIAPDWDMPFELMYDASNFAIGAVLGQRQEKHFKPIHYASKTMTEVESNYSTTKKEMLGVVYAFEKFWSYLIMNKSIVYTDHSALKYLFAKKDSKARFLRWVLLLQEFTFKDFIGPPFVGNKMHKAFPLLVRKFPLPEGTSHCLKKNATARRKVMPLPEDCTAVIVKKKLSVKDDGFLKISALCPTLYSSSKRKCNIVARIAQSSTLPPVADELASLVRDVSQGEACPTDFGFIVDQDKATIAKSSTLPHDSAPMVTSPIANEGSMQPNITELTILCTSLQRQHSELLAKFQAQVVEILKLKERVKVLEDREGIASTRSGDDAPIKGMSMDEGEVATERISDDIAEIEMVLTSIDAATVLAGGIDDVPTDSGSIPTAGPPATDIPTGSDVVPTASLVFTTATVVTQYSRKKGKKVMVESDTPKKQRLQEQIDAQVASELEEQLEREDKRMSEQIARDAEVARIHAEEELQSMIDGLNRNNETIAKYLQKYQQFAAELPLERRIELISDLVKYQENYAKIYKFQSQQRRSWTKKQKRDYYMAVIRNNLGWKVKDFKEEAKRYKRNGIRFDQESSKKLKSSKEVIEEAKSTDEIPEEKIKEMLQLIPIEEVYVEALQVKNPIIDWKVHKEGQRSYWKIIRLGGSSACYHFFLDLLKHLDREDLNQLWILVKEYLSIRPASSDKEMELWVELKRLVHQVTAKDKEIFMLVEKDYPLRKGLALVMICYKLQVENFSQMANDLVLKIYKITNSPRQQGD